MRKINTFQDLYDEFEDGRPFIAKWLGEECLMQIDGYVYKHVVSFYVLRFLTGEEFFNNVSCEYNKNSDASFIEIIDWIEKDIKINCCSCDDYRIMLGYPLTCQKKSF